MEKASGKSVATGKESGKKGKEKKGDDAAVKETVSLSTLFRYAGAADFLLVAFGTLGACASGALRPISSILFGQILRDLNRSHDIVAAVSVQSVNYCYLAAAGLVVGFLQSWCWALVAERQAFRIRQKYLEALLRTEVAHYDIASSGQLVGSLSENIVMISTAIGEKIGSFQQTFSTFIAGMVIGFYSGWRLTLVMLGCVPLLAATGGFSTKLMATRNAKEAKMYSQASAISHETFSAMRTVAAFNGEERAKRTYTQAIADCMRLGIQQKTISGVGLGLTTLVMNSVFALCMWYGALLIRQGEMDGGKVMTTFFSVMMGGSSLGQAAPNFDAFARGKGAGYNVFKVIDRKPAIDSSSKEGAKPAKVVGDIAFKAVRFAYSSRVDNDGVPIPVFEDFNLTIPAGKSVALVGESGGGKSTVVQLVMRFYDVLEGSVTLDGTDIRQLNIQWLRRQIGLVSQEPVLFACTIKENILYGDPSATDQQVEAATKAANAHGFVSKLSHGIDTYVGERGAQLSGGQKQRIAIARAILKDPKILVLDEATSALDTASERIVQDALDKVMAGRTSIVVAHRLTTIRNADKICCFRKGKVVEEGTHAELVEREDGLYSSLLKLQGPGRGSVGAPSTANLSGMVPTPSMLELQEAVAEADEAPGGAGMEDTAARLVPAGAAKGGRSSELEASGSGSSGGGSGAVELAAVAVDPAAATRRSADGPRHHALTDTAEAAAAASKARAVAAAALDADAEKEGKKGAKGGKPDAPDANAQKGGKKGGKGDAGADATDTPEGASPVPLIRLAQLNKPEAPFFVVGVLSAMITGVRMPCLATLIAKMLGVFFERDFKKQERDTEMWAALMFMIGAVAMIFMVIQNYCAGVIGQRLVLRIRNLAFAAALRQEIAYFDDTRNNTGALSSRLAVDAAQIRLLVAEGILAHVSNLSTFVAAMTIALVGGWQLALVVVGTTPLTIMSFYYSTKRLSGLQEGSRSLYEQATQLAMDAVSNIRTVASFTAEETVLRQFGERLEGPLEAARKQAVTLGVNQAITQAMNSLPQALIFYVGGVFVSHKLLTFAEMMQVFFALIFAAIGVSQTTALAGDTSGGKPAAASLFSLIDRRPAIDSASSDGEKPSSCEGAIALSNVRFVYPSRPGFHAMDGFSLNVPAGTVQALVGESGSGKSTCIQLLLRYYDPVDGQVFLDGKDLRQLNIKWLRSRLGLVSQEPNLFATTIWENICYSRAEEDPPTQAEVEAAAKAANVLDFIKGLPEGFQTQVGERGVQLSGGQKQRIAIARVMLKDPRVLLLDEATSALDNQSEQIVQEALDAIMESRTTIVVAHRLTSIRKATSIAVVAGGRIVEQGTHEELLAAGGAFSKLSAVREG